MKLYKICNKISLLLHVLASAAGYFVMEAICRHSFIEAWNYMIQRPLVFAYNAAFIFTSSLIVYLFHRRVFWRVLVTLFWLILAIINGVLLLNRVTPFTGPDLHLITDAMKIANKYLPVAGVVAVCILFGILVILLLMLLIKGPKYQKKIKYRYNIPLILLAVALFAGSTQLALEKRVLSNYFGNIAFAYEDYGYPYCLATTIFNTGISCPRDYSEKEIKRIEKTEKNLPETQEEKRPNILFLQLESFFDPTKILIVDDDNNIAELIALYLTKECFETKIVNDGEEALREFASFRPDLIILDLMLPGIDGYQVCREIRHTSDVPIIMLSAKGETFDKVLGLELGADDYMIKPFDSKELVARVRAVLRRFQVKQPSPSSSEKCVTYPDLTVNLTNYAVTYMGRQVDMPPKELELLYFLAASPNQVFTREQLLDHIWGYEYIGDTRTVDVHIKRLREKIKDNPHWSIATVWGIGYKFEVKNP